MIRLPLNVIDGAVPAIRRKVVRQGLILRKNSHILFGVGVVGFVTTVVMSSRATLKLSDTMQEIETDLTNVKEARRVLSQEGQEPEFYSTGDLNRDVAIAYLKAAYKLGRLYAPALAAGSVSLGAFSGAHITLNRRNASLAAAYAAVQKAFDEYQERVAKEIGSERANEIKHDVVKAVDEDGDVIVPREGASPYARFFDSACEDWKKNPELNRMFIMCQLNYANDRLRARGHLFLNEVYDSLGMERTPAGQIVGWVMGGDGDDFVSFDLDNPINARFMQGLERTPFLDFNVDGPVYDLL